MEGLAAGSAAFDLAELGAYRAGPSLTGRSAEDARAAAREFEAFFLSQVLETLQLGVSTEAPFGGGPGERAFRSFLSEEHANAIVGAGGVGIADRLYRDILALQTEEAA